MSKKIASQYMVSTNKWSINQCGFKIYQRTDDNLFLLHIIYESYVTNKNKKIYIGFVDFSKLFDTIDREPLFYKLLKYGITCSVYYVIKIMCSHTQFRVQIHYLLSLNVKASDGVKQGYPMSPILSNIFRKDLHDFFTQKCDPVCLNGTSFNSISLVDVILLLSLLKRGLQTCLIKLLQYCTKWGLAVNTSMAKHMVITKQMYQFELLVHNNEAIDCVRTFNYWVF